jgi:ureidoglycolate hydrolase
MSLTRPIEPLTAEAMEPLGYLIQYPGGEGFQPICSETDAVGWQIAANRITNRSVDRLACHPNTMESFEPVSGVAVIVLATPDAPDQWRAFVLDRPICIRKGVWHATLTLSGEAVVKIVENVNVDAQFHPLSKPIEPLVAPGRGA